MSMKTHNGAAPAEGPTDWGTSRVKQSATDETDINLIFKRFEETGELTHISNQLMSYRDASLDPKDLHEAMNIVADAQSLFNELPGSTRHRLGHDVANFLPFIDNPENLDECIELGLLPPETKTVPKAQEPIPVDPPPAPPNGGE